MFYVQKRMEIAGSHSLKLPYRSKCENLHGHNWIVTVYCKSETLTPYGMVIDFTHIKQAVHDLFDHHNINEVFAKLELDDFNPTAENVAITVCHLINNDVADAHERDGNRAICYRVEVQESEGNIATYEVDE